MLRVLLLIIACGCAAPAPAPAPAPTAPVAAARTSLTVVDRGREPRRVLRYPSGAASCEVRLHRRWREQHTDSHRPDRDSGIQLTPYEVESLGHCEAFADGGIELVIERETGDVWDRRLPLTLRYRRTARAFEVGDALNDPRHLLPEVLPSRFPDEPLGAGARWEDVDHGHRAAWEVAALEGDRVVLRATTSRKHFTRQASSTEDAQIEVALDLAHLRVDATRTSSFHSRGTHSLGTTTSSRNEEATVTIR